jgi:Leu/Phe-tRNA-protein transferase
MFACRLHGDPQVNHEFRNNEATSDIEKTYRVQMSFCMWKLPPPNSYANGCIPSWFESQMPVKFYRPHERGRQMLNQQNLMKKFKKFFRMLKSRALENICARMNDVLFTPKCI